MNTIKKENYTPMMQQYISIKEDNPDTLIFFRLGDFYELFFEDAKIASRVLDLTLTGRQAGSAEKVPMCGVPYHAAGSYIERLISKGYKVGIAEQLEESSKVQKGIVKRGVVQFITPGAAMDVKTSDRENNYLVAVTDCSTSYAISFCDLTIGELKVIKVDYDLNQVVNELETLKCKELVVANKELGLLIKEKKDNILISPFAHKELALEQQYLVADIKDIRLINCLALLVGYISATQLRPLDYLRKAIQLYPDNYLKMDNFTRMNLELTKTMRGEGNYGTLYWLLDKTKTSMGARLLRQWIDRPLSNVSLINERLNFVELLTKKYMILSQLRDELENVYDIERLSGKIGYGNANGRDLLLVAKSLKTLPKLKEILISLNTQLTINLVNQVDNLEEICDLLEKTIDENAPLTIKEGSIIKKGYSEKLDQLKNISVNNKQWIANLELQERERTGIRSLKVGYNNVFGYYIEVTKSNLHLVKDEYGYQRKQTTSNSERYITAELKEKENLILNATELINKLEFELFCEIRDIIKSKINIIQKNSDVIAYIDVIASFAQVSSNNRYTKPIINTENKNFIATNSRHPVLEQINRQQAYIPNDINITVEQFILLITGPNMGGKSTYMRQVALIAIMTQVGCFVPATNVTIPIFDAIYTRIGASDDMIKGQSTFMVEMCEVNYALQNATANSLILFDEIGRGTSTYDGMALAQAIIENIAFNCKAKTLFSTHYHELTNISNSIKAIVNVHASVYEEDNNITFMYKIIEGPASKSYGVNVAKLASIDENILVRAQQILSQLENKITTNNKVEYELVSNKAKSSAEHEIIKLLRNVKPLEISPLEAINILYDLKQKISE